MIYVASCQSLQMVVVQFPWILQKMGNGLLLGEEREEELKQLSWKNTWSESKVRMHVLWFDLQHNLKYAASPSSPFAILTTLDFWDKTMFSVQIANNLNN